MVRIQPLMAHCGEGATVELSHRGVGTGNVLNRLANANGTSVCIRVTEPERKNEEVTRTQ